MSLLREIQEAAISADIELTVVLRKCKVLAVRIGSDELKSWVDSELSGYKDVESLPSYRIINVTSKGHFSGAFNSGLKNADIPLSCIPKEYRESLSKSNMMEPIASLESLAIDSKGSCQEPWNSDFVAHFGQQIYSNMNCMQAWKVIPINSIIGALDAVRNRILNFVLVIEGENPDAGEAQINSNPLPQEKMSQIFNTYISGNVQNVATGSSNVEQNATMEANNDVFNNLLHSLLKANIESPINDSFTGTVEEMKASQGTPLFKDHYQNFMSILADHMQVYGPVVAPFLPALAAMVP
jgi:hypothetical protein